MTSIVSSRILQDRISTRHLDAFLLQEGITIDRKLSKFEKIEYLQSTISENEDLKSKFNCFLAEECKYNDNRSIITVPFSATHKSSVSSQNKFEKEFSDFKNYNKYNLLTDKNLQDWFNKDSNKFHQVYFNVEFENEKVISVSESYVKMRRNKVTHNNGTKKEEFEDIIETVWIDVYPQERMYRIHFLEKSRDEYSENSSIHSIYKEFSRIIERKFNIRGEAHSASHVFYKMYKDLTKTAIQPYVDKVKPEYDKISNFVNEISSEISYSDQKEGSIGLDNRVKKIFERALIQQDIVNVVKSTENKKGFVDTFQYKDPTGGRVHASVSDDASDMSMHDIYFDTKETIDINQQLDAIWVRWFKKEGDRIEQIKIKYESYDSFYLTHFLYRKISKGVSEYVLPKYGEFEKQSVQ